MCKNISQSAILTIKATILTGFSSSENRAFMVGFKNLAEVMITDVPTIRSFPNIRP